MDGIAFEVPLKEYLKVTLGNRVMLRASKLVLVNEPHLLSPFANFLLKSIPHTRAQPSQFFVVLGCQKMLAPVLDMGWKSVEIGEEKTENQPQERRMSRRKRKSSQNVPEKCGPIQGREITIKREGKKEGRREMKRERGKGGMKDRTKVTKRREGKTESKQVSSKR